MKLTVWTQFPIAPPVVDWQVTPVGIGNSPPEINVADSPEMAVRFGSASVRTTPALSIARSVAWTDGVEPNDPVMVLPETEGGPTVALVWEGREAVSACRVLMGLTDGAKSPPGTIRGDFGLSVQNNLVHGSDSTENAAAEIALWFKPEELVGYTPTDASWVG